jgi:hypothetical protein
MLINKWVLGTFELAISLYLFFRGWSILKRGSKFAGLPLRAVLWVVKLIQGAEQAEVKREQFLADETQFSLAGQMILLGWLFLMLVVITVVEI